MVFDVIAGQAVQFGVYLGFPPASWIGDGSSSDVDARISYYCTTIGSSAGSALGVALVSDGPDKAGIEQDRQARRR
jgi:hypothetical protein